jgi:hypothetical protein
LGAFYPKNVGGVIEGFYVDDTGQEVQITENGQLKLPSTLGETNTASNLSGGEGIFAQKVLEDLQFKSLVAGTNISLTSAANTITIDAVSIGEANTASNVGGGNEVFKQKALEDLQFRTLVAGPNVTIVADTDTLTISAASGGGSSLSVRDEGSIVSSAVTELNFTGTGVAATQTSPGVIEVAVSTGIGGSDELTKVSSNDTTAGYLLDKLQAGSNISITEQNNASNETLLIDVTGIESGAQVNHAQVSGPEKTAGTETSLRSFAPADVKDMIDTHTSGGGGGAVDSVNGETGVVVLDADDIDDSSTAHKFTSSADISKLAGIEIGAEVNPGVVPQAEAEEGTATTERIWTAERVKQAIDALAPAGGGGSIAIEDEGSEIVATASRINFTGAGVTATDAGSGEVTVDIPASGGGSFVSAQINIPTGASLAARVAAATGLPGGWSVVLGNDGSVDSNLGGTSTDIVIIHNEGRPASFNVFKDFGTIARQEEVFSPSSLETLQNNSYNQIILKNFETKT